MRVGYRVISALTVRLSSCAMQQTLNWLPFSRYNDMAAGLKSAFLARSLILAVLFPKH